MEDRIRRILKNGVVLAVAALLVRTVTVSFGAYVSGRIGAEGMGLYSLIMSVYTLAVTLATSGVQLATTRLVAEALGRGDEGGARGALRLAVRYALLFGAVSSVTLFLFAPGIGQGLLRDGRTVPALRLLAVSLLPIALSSVFSGYFTAVRRPTRAAAVSMLEQAVRMILTVFLLTALLPSGMTYACLALVGGSAVAEILSALWLSFLYLYDSRRLRRAKAGKMPIGEMLHITLPIAASSYLRSGLVSAEHMLIPRALTGGGATREEALGAYGTLSGMSMPIALYPMAVLSAFAGLLVPELSEGIAKREQDGNRRLCERALMLALWFGIAAGGVMAAFARPLSAAVYGSGEAGHYLSLLAPIVPVMYLDHVTDVMLKGLGRQVYAMGVNILDSVGSILLVLLLLPRLGAVGYVLVILLAEIFNFALSITGLHTALPFRFPTVKGVLLPVAAILLAVTAVRWLIPISGVVTTVLSVVLTLILYILLLSAALSLLSKKPAKSEVTPRRPLDNAVTFGYNKRERDVAPWGKKE